MDARPRSQDPEDVPDLRRKRVSHLEPPADVGASFDNRIQMWVWDAPGDLDDLDAEIGPLCDSCGADMGDCGCPLEGGDAA